MIGSFRDRRVGLLTSPPEGGLNNRLQKGYASLRRWPLRSRTYYH
jgi:hypothetical protein